jgi:histone-arginine methyltransferase CARM1
MSAVSSRGSPDSALVPVLPEWAGVHQMHYQMLSSHHQMLADPVRTGAYHRAITTNRADFEGRTVLDVGAGTGILSIFAAQAGARKVYAVEATAIAEHARRLIQHNGLSDRIEVLHCDLAAVALPEQVDIVLSEPWGFFLFHERMVETFLLARDRLLAPGGMMVPAKGRLWLAPFSDVALFQSRVDQRRFWSQPDFYGVDLSALSPAATEELFERPVLRSVGADTLMAGPARASFDFRTQKVVDLAEIRVPFRFVAAHAGPIHGLAGWFDVTFEGSAKRVQLSTAPDAPLTHWHHLCFVFREPANVRVGQRLEGSFVLQANPQSSYTARLEATLEGHGPLPAQVFRLQDFTG